MKLGFVHCMGVLSAGLLAAVCVAAEPVVVARGEGTLAPKQPQATLAADGTVHLVYGVGEQVYHCRSVDGGVSFTEPRVAFRTANMSLGMRRGPRVAVAQNAIVISAIGGAQGKGRDGDLMAWRSTDNGDSWQGPTRVNDVAASAREGLHAMTADSDGSVWCVWLDLRAKGTQLYAARSDDGGARWTKNQLVYRSPGGSICECCHPSIATQGKAVHVLFRNSVDGNRDMYLVSSPDGKQFESARRLGTEHWPLNACPMDGGMLAVDSEGEVSTVWRRAGLVFATSGSGTEEALLGPGEQPWVASRGANSVAVWTSKREGELFATSLGHIEPRLLASVARDPMIATSASGKGPLLVCWESKKEGQSVIEAMPLDMK